jgi:hypothetical protein
MNESVEQSASAWQRLGRAATVALLVHLAAGVSMLLILRNGLETNPDLSSRLRFVADHKLLWIAGWVPWNLAALSIVVYFYSFTAAHKRSELLRVALIFGAVGMVTDLAAESIEMGVIPDLAAGGLTDVQSFLTVHRIAVMLTGFTANGLYSLASLLMAWATRSHYPAWVTISGMTVGIVGFALSAAALFDSTEGMFWTNAILIPSLLAWMAGVALDAKQRCE